MTQRYIDLVFDDAAPRSFGGFDNENEATVIRLKVVNPDAKYYLEIERACAKHDKYCSDALPVADGYATFEIPRDFTHETLYVQGVMKADGVCRKTARVRVGFGHSINALDELPESHPSWADSVDERLKELEQNPVLPDWNQNDENAQDYVKNRTHWKEVESLKYEGVKLKHGYPAASTEMYYLGQYIGVSGSSIVWDYPFSFYMFGSIGSIIGNYRSLYNLSLPALIYDKISIYNDNNLIKEYDINSLVTTQLPDGSIAVDISQDPLKLYLDYDITYTVVLETKPVYHKIPQEYLNTYVFELERDKNGKVVSPLSSDEIVEMVKNGTQVICLQTKATAPGNADYHFAYDYPLDDGCVAVFTGGAGSNQEIVEIYHDKHVGRHNFGVVSVNDLDAYQPRSIEDSEEYFGKNPTVEGALTRLWEGKVYILQNTSDGYRVTDRHSNVVDVRSIMDDSVIIYGHSVFHPHYSDVLFQFLSIGPTEYKEIKINRFNGAISYEVNDNFILPRPIQTTSNMTQAVGVDDNGKLWTAPAPTITLRTWADVEEPT